MMALGPSIIEKIIIRVTVLFSRMDTPGAGFSPLRRSIPIVARRNLLPLLLVSIRRSVPPRRLEHWARRNRGIMAKVLLVGYIREFQEAEKNVLHAAGYQVTTAFTLEAAHQAINQETFDVA